MSNSIQKIFTTKDASDLDKESRNLVSIFSAARIKIGLSLAKNLKQFEDGKLYLKLDASAYPTFNEYLRSLDINYKTAREIIGIYETFVLAAGMSIDELADIAYHKLTTIKPLLFDKVEGEYKLIKSKVELKQWIADAKSNLTREDLAQKRKEEEVGEHQHDFFLLRVCRVCKLKEIHNEKEKY